MDAETFLQDWLVAAKYIQLASATSNLLLRFYKKNAYSHSWQGQMEVKPLFRACCWVHVCSGDKTCILEDH
jgi:hypothetical protein